MKPVEHNPKGPKKNSRWQLPQVGSPLFRFIFFIEAALIFSIIASYLILFVVKTSGKDAGVIATPLDYSNLFKNYRILNQFINLPIRSEEIQDPEFEIGNPFVADSFKLETAADDLGENGEKIADEIVNIIRDIEQKHKKHPHRYGFILKNKNRLFLKYLFLIKNHPEIISSYENNPDSFDSLSLKISLINSLVKTKDTEKAFTIFKELLKTNNIGEFSEIIPRQTLNNFLRQLDYDYWFEKFRTLSYNNQYSEFNRLRKYIRSPQLINLFRGEFSYWQKQYAQCKKYLAAVKDENLLPYKDRIIIKINLREKNYEPDKLIEQMASIKKDGELYQEILLDAGSILLTDGEVSLAKRMFSKYLAVTNFLQYGYWIRFCYLNTEPFPGRGGDYWRILWISAWLNYQDKDKKAAVSSFQEGAHSPNISYRLANRYWLKRLKQDTSFNLDLERYPFTYYYTLNRDPHDFKGIKPTLRTFIRLLNHNQSRYFQQVITDLKDMVHFNLLDKAADFIHWVLKETGENLTISDKHTLMLIESILYLRQGNYAMAFIRFRDNFECYQCIRLPHFLQQIVLPVKYSTLINRYAEMNQIDPELIYSLIREESFFRKDVISPANACGLMQLMLSTARQVAYSRRQKVYRSDLFNAETNIQIGVEYLKYLLDKYKGKLQLALAAYNAGDYRVDEWLERFGNVSDDEFVEMIPFTETRSYVKNILRNYFYYRFYKNHTKQ